jgi:hypothetical protein
MERGMIIVVDDASIGRTAMLHELLHQQLGSIVVVDINDDKEIARLEFPNFAELPKPLLAPPELKCYGDKYFVCNGIHEYRQVITQTDSGNRVDWVCQCGRKTTD